MDLSTLKAEHSAVYQAAFDEGKQSINANALVSDSVTAERTRIAAILACDEAKGRELQAQTLALETDLNAEQAAKILASAPIADAKPTAQNGFIAHMNSMKNHAVGTGQEPDDETDDEGAEAKAVLALFGK